MSIALIEGLPTALETCHDKSELSSTAALDCITLSFEMKIAVLATGSGTERPSCSLFGQAAGSCSGLVELYRKPNGYFWRRKMLTSLIVSVAPKYFRAACRADKLWRMEVTLR